MKTMKPLCAGVRHQVVQVSIICIQHQIRSCYPPPSRHPFPPPRVCVLFLFFDFYYYFFVDSKNKDFKSLVLDLAAHHIDER